MERDELTEECYHPKCSDTRWLRYCIEEGQDPEGDAAVSIGFIEAVLYESERFERGNFRYEGSGRSREFSRSYELTDLLDNELQIAGVRTHVAVHHVYHAQFEKNEYVVVAEWEIPHEDERTGAYHTSYYIEIYPTRLHATITEYDLSTELLRSGGESLLHDRPMTGYDHAALCELLGRVHDYQKSEAADDARASAAAEKS